MRSEIIPIVACDNYITVFNTSTTKFHPRIRLFHKKFQKKKSVQPTDRPTIQFNSLYMCPGKPTHPPTYAAHRLFDCSDGDLWLRTWVAPRRHSEGNRRTRSTRVDFGSKILGGWGGSLSEHRGSSQSQIPCRDVVMPVQCLKCF
jgi:hypothetical protein